MGRLSSSILAVLPFVEYAEEEQRDDKAVGSLLRDLQRAAADADRILNQLARAGSIPKKKQQALCFLFGSCSGPRPRLISSELKSVRERLDKIANKGSTLSLRWTDDLSHHRLNRLDRAEEKEEVLRLLLSEDSAEVQHTSIIPIVGRGGMGKTALIRLVYNDQRAVDHFSRRIWFRVSDFLDVGTLFHRDFWQDLEGERFLLVLDDVYDESVEWVKLCRFFDAGDEGSRVVVTTRSDIIASKMGTVPSYRLTSLSLKDSWLLFKASALFVDEEHPELEAIGKKIVNRLEGLPLAIQMIGSLLRSNLHQSSWESILESDAWRSQPLDVENRVPPAAVRLSYQRLPPHFRRCIAYCSVFPRDHEFDKDELIRIWMAHGLLRHRPGKRMEDVGSEFVDYMLRMSFFLCFSTNYIMHPLLHDLGRRISVDDCFRSITTSTEVLPMDTALSRSLRTFVYTTDDLNLDDALFMKLKFIRVLCLRASGIQEIPESIGYLQHLRYLDLSGIQMMSLPESVCGLYSLQTLKLDDMLPSDLPEGMSGLICLRHLEANMKAVSQIAGIGKLTALQELKMFTVDDASGHRIEELKDLSELHGELRIRNLNNVSGREEAARARLIDKEHLEKLVLEWDKDREWDGRPRGPDDDVLEGLQPHPNLKGLIVWRHCGARFPSWIECQWLSNLETIELHCCQTWFFAPLGKLRFLKYLYINGDLIVGDDLSEEIQSFGTQGWDGSEEGEEDSQLFPNLRVLRISYCFHLRRLPPLPPTLTELFVEQVGLTSLRQGFVPQRLLGLESLTISSCRYLESFPEDGLQSLKSLKSLVLEDCGMLTWSPERGGCFPSSIVDLKITGCSGVTNDSFYMGLQNMASLSSLYIEDYESSLTPLSGGILCRLTKLKGLKIVDYDVLTIEGNQALTSLPPLLGASSLEYLEIKADPLVFLTREILQNLTSLRELKIGLGALTREAEAALSSLKALKSMHIEESDHLQSLPTVLYNLTLLEELYITDCRNFRCVPEKGMPTSLNILAINGCSLRLEDYQKGGPEWSKIAHIPYVEIDKHLIDTEE